MDIKPYIDHNEQLFEVYRELNLQSIDDFHAENKVKWGNKNFITYFTDITRSSHPINGFDTSDFKMYDDFVILSGDIKYCAGMLSYLYPYISKDPNQFTSTLIDRRYIMHVSFAYQSIYHFWDRIGDLLWIYFPTGIKENNIKTSEVLKLLPEAFKSSEQYEKIKSNFASFNLFIKTRHDIVHRCSLGTELYWKRIYLNDNRRKMNKFSLKITNYKNNITESLPVCIQSLELALELISLLDTNENKS